MFLERKKVIALRNKYPKGIMVQLDYMDDQQAPPVGTKGFVEQVDDAGSIHVHWENGSGLALLPDSSDEFHIIGNQTIAYNIDYDCEESDLDYLPVNMVIPDNLLGDDDAIADYITNKTGYCIKGFSLSGDNV